MPMPGFWRTKRITVRDVGLASPRLPDDVFRTVVDAVRKNAKFIFIWF